MAVEQGEKGEGKGKGSECTPILEGEAVAAPTLAFL